MRSREAERSRHLMRDADGVQASRLQLRATQKFPREPPPCALGVALACTSFLSEVDHLPRTRRPMQFFLCELFRRSLPFPVRLFILTDFSELLCLKEMSPSLQNALQNVFPA